MAFPDTAKEECFRPMQLPVKIEPQVPGPIRAGNGASVVEISSSSSSSGGDARSSHGDFEKTAGEVTSPLVTKRSSFQLNNIAGSVGTSAKRPRIENVTDLQSSPAHSGKGTNSRLSHESLQPLADQRSFFTRAAMASPPSVPRASTQNRINKPFRQFWKAGDYESDKTSHKSMGGGMDHVRVHPKFLHSNATSHKWALGAVAELLDNALDEVVHEATYVKIDMIRNPRSGEPMLLIEDDGGGMNPESMRQCMSLGYSAKSKIANTIGQYGNGFKTSTMRLGADVVVFSRCQENKGIAPTESIGMLSYTFLRETGQEDIIVPMIDYEIQPFGLRKIIRSNVEDWNRNMESIQRWSPYATEAELMDHFKDMQKQGTKIIIYNLWEDDQGQLELDFETNRYDIQLRGVNRDENHIKMAKCFPSSRHYLTYQHSLRIYASVLYLKLPPGFRMFLRGKEIEHHNVIDDLMFTEVLTYRPVASDVQTDTCHMKAVVTVGFVKDAREHIDVQGFNVYHKNRLIKPFWRLWNSAASSGRGIVGVLEANFVEPAHDKQGFERTIVLARLEARLIEMQKTYWSKHCHKVGYVNNSVIGRAARAAEQQGASSALEAVQPTLAVPSSVAPPAQNISIPGGLVRSQQLQSQVQVSRKVTEVNSQMMPQVRAYAVPMQSMSAGISPQRHIFSTVGVSSSQARTQLQERLPGQSHNAAHSHLPPTASGRVSISQPEAAKRVASFSDAQANHASPDLRGRHSDTSGNWAQNPPVHSTTLAGGARAQLPRSGGDTFRPAVCSTGANLAQNSPICSTAPAISQPPWPAGEASTGFLSPPVRSTTLAEDASTQPRTSDANLAQSSRVCSTAPAISQPPWPAGEASTGIQSPPVRCTTSAEDASSQPCRSGGEAFTPVVGSPHPVLRESAMAQSCTPALPNRVADGHSPRHPNLLSNHVSTSAQDAFMSGAILANEGSKSPVTGVCGAGGKEQQVNDSNRENGQILTTITSFIPSKAQPTVQGNAEVFVQDESHRVEEFCARTAAHSPSTSLGTEINDAQVTQLPPEMDPLKVSRLSNKEYVLGQKTLEDLGRTFAKKAASITVNQDDQSKNYKVIEDECTEPVANINSIVEIGTNQELDARPVELEVEVKNLQQRLEVLKVERDSLRHLLLEEQLRGLSSKEELQRKVEQTWAKVRELEAKSVT